MDGTIVLEDASLECLLENDLCLGGQGIDLPIDFFDFAGDGRGCNKLASGISCVIRLGDEA